MLQAINDRIKGWLGMVIVVLIGLPFALWGISSYFDDAGPRYAAKVNNVEISANEFERTVSIQRQRLLRQYQGELPIEDKALREKTLQQLINQRLLETVSFDNGYRVSDSLLAVRIKQQFSVDGEFDRIRFENYVASIGMNIPMYEQVLRNEIRTQQIQAAIANSAFVTKQETQNLATISEQTRDISVLTFNIDHFSTATKPSADEVNTYYKDNLRRFMVPEKVKVDYVEITSDTLADNIKVEEEQVRSMYDNYVTSIGSREERKASHILILTKEDKVAAIAKVEALKLKLDSGADFAELAKSHSQDPSSADEGGDLGWVTIGDQDKPFEDALFELKEGGVSEIVETKFGYHLIKLAAVRGETVESFEMKRYEFEEELKVDSVASMFYDLSERLAATAYENPDSLDNAVEDLELKIKTSDYFTRVIGQGVATEEKVRNIAFSSLVLEQGSNSDIIEISPTHVVVLRINEHVPATAMPLEIVSSKIENILNVQNGHKQTKEAASIVRAKIEAGESIGSINADGVDIEVIKSVARTDNAKVADPSILLSAFALMPNQEGKVSVNEVDLFTGDVALVVLDQVNSVEQIAKVQLDLVESEVNNESAIRDFSSALQSMKDHADIDKNSRIIDK